MESALPIPCRLVRGEILTNPALAHLYVWLIGNSENGALVKGVRSIAAETGYSYQRVRGFLAKLQSMGLITQQATHDTTQQATQITISTAEIKPKRATHKTTQQATQTTTHPPTPEIVCSWVEPEFREVWLEWLRYRKERRNTYKSEASAKVGYEQLKKKSGGDPAQAMEIVRQSIANGYQGMFPVKNSSTYEQSQQTDYRQRGKGDAPGTAGGGARSADSMARLAAAVMAVSSGS